MLVAVENNVEPMIIDNDKVAKLKNQVGDDKVSKQLPSIAVK